VRRTARATLADAQRLIDEGLFFHAHEVLEDAWKSSAPPERALWRGLAQFAVGLTHAARGNPVGAAALLRRAADTIAPYAEGPAPYGVDAAGVAGWARQQAALLGGGADLPKAPRLYRTGP
jgi:hypothetical protein